MLCTLQDKGGFSERRECLIPVLRFYFIKYHAAPRSMVVCMGVFPGLWKMYTMT